MGRILKRTRSRRFLYSLFIAIPFVVSVFTASGYAQSAPAPLLQKGASPVDWWFIFKFNTKFFSRLRSECEACLHIRRQCTRLPQRLRSAVNFRQ
jgi:hypothetical protein